MWSVWLVFCDCGFHSVCPLMDKDHSVCPLMDKDHSVCPLMDKDKRVMETSWWREWLRGKLGLVLMGGAMISKSLIQLSVDSWGCVSSLLFDLRPNYGGGNEDNGDLLQKVLCMHCPTQCPQPCSRSLLTHASVGDSWTLMGKSGSVPCGVTAPFSWVLVSTRFCLCPPRVSFHSPVSSGGSMVGLMATSSKRAYAILRSPAPRAPAPATDHCWPIPPQETLKRSKAGMAQSLWGLLACTGFVWALQTAMAGMGFDSKHDFAPPTILLELLLCPWMWGIFWWDWTFSVNSCSAASCNFGLLTEDKCTSLYSTILRSDCTVQLHSSRTLAK